TSRSGRSRQRARPERDATRAISGPVSSKTPPLRTFLQPTLPILPIFRVVVPEPPRKRGPEMSRKTRYVHYAVYLAVRCSVLLFQLMPPSWALGVAGLLAWLAYRLDKRHRLVAADNLHHAFPQKSEAQIDRLVRATYRHLFTMAIETAILLRRMR